MTSPLCVATGGWCRRVFHYRPPTPMYRNSPPLCTIVLQIPSLMPLKMRKVQERRAGNQAKGAGQSALTPLGAAGQKLLPASPSARCGPPERPQHTQRRGGPRRQHRPVHQSSTAARTGQSQGLTKQDKSILRQDRILSQSKTQSRNTSRQTAPHPQHRKGHRHLP